MIRYISMLKWAEDANVDSASLITKLEELANRVPGIVSIGASVTNSLVQDGYDFVVTIDFADADGYTAYRSHPESRAVIADYVRPHIAERAAISVTVAG